MCQLAQYGAMASFERRIDRVGTPRSASCEDARMAESPIHPDLRRRARFLPRGMPGRNPARSLRILESLLERRPVPGDVEVVSVGAMNIRIHRPPDVDPSERLPALLWIHGGGYVVGRASHEDDLCRTFARSTGALVAAVDYRTAPEHRWPTAVEDCHDALLHLAGRGEVDPDRIAIGGASAGGGLAAALAILARDRDEVTPILQLLTYPMLDDRTALRTDVDERPFRMWNNKANRYGWRSYLGAEPASRDFAATAVPARATDDQLRDLPPAWMGVGDLDLFHDEDLAYAKRLRAAGVLCPVHLVPGAFHAFDAVVAKAPVSRRFREEQIRVLREAFSGRRPRP